MLAALKVPSDIRARLLSHGLRGVQYCHYDLHDYMVEKKQALEFVDKRAAVAHERERPWVRQVLLMMGGPVAARSEIGRAHV